MLDNLINFQGIYDGITGFANSVTPLDMAFFGLGMLFVGTMLFFGKIVFLEKILLKLMVEAEEIVEGYKMGDTRAQFVIDAIWSAVPALKYKFKTKEAFAPVAMELIEKNMEKAMEIVQKDIAKRESK